MSPRQIPVYLLMCKFINEKGEALGPNIDGEILVKSSGAMKGYWDMQESQAAFTVDEEGWLHTGDVGHYDKDGYIYVLGRQKDIVLVRGKKIIQDMSQHLGNYAYPVSESVDCILIKFIQKPHLIDLIKNKSDIVWTQLKIPLSNSINPRILQLVKPMHEQNLINLCENL